MRLAPGVAVYGIGAVSPLGLDAAALRADGASAIRMHALATGAGLAASINGDLDGVVPADVRTRRLMSVGAKLAAAAARQALLDGDARWRGLVPRAGVGYYLGVGASGDVGDDLAAVVAGSLEHGAYADAAFGRRGLRAMHPLKTFLLLSNFTMCHSALLEGTRGPNYVMFSRGAGTAHALVEATAAIVDGACELALAGGADTGLSAFTLCELQRAGHLARGVVPGEGGAVLLLGPAGRDAARAIIEVIALPARRDGELAEIRDVLDGAGHVVISASVPADAAAARAAAAAAGAAVIDLGARIGDALAGGPALAWALAAQLPGPSVALTRGLDGVWCAVRLRAASTASAEGAA